MTGQQKKYHIGKNGAAECKATKRACRYGDASTHYATMQEAEDAYAKQNNLSTTAPSLKKTAQPVQSPPPVPPKVPTPPAPTATEYEDYMMLQKVDVRNNNNKFYELKVVGNDLVARYGRVGQRGVTKTYHGEAYRLHEQARAKMRKGYKTVNVLREEKTPDASKDSLREAAVSGILKGRNIPEIKNMVNHLVDNNIHQIGAFSGGKLRVVNGNVSGPLGLVTRQNLNDAQNLLQDIDREVDHLQKLYEQYPPKYGEIQESEGKITRMKEQYMALVPQDIGTRREALQRFLMGKRAVQQQQDFIDQLKAQVDLAEAMKNKDNQSTTGMSHKFRYDVDLVSDQKEIERLKKKFYATANSMHGNLSNAKVKNVYAINDTKDGAFDHAQKNIRNVQELWHGSRSYNILSILNKGLVTPDNLSTAKTAGAMFGNGLYFSNQSTKSAQYSRGGIYSSGRDNKFYMIVADVAMGYEYRPGRNDYNSSSFYNERLHGRTPDATGKKYNSINVKSGHGGVRNHEAIVPSADQVKIKYILEFEG